MLTRSLLRDLVAGILVASGLVGAVAASHAQVAFWQQVRPDGRSARMQPQPRDGWQMASVRAESREHVQAQIDRMEARARADDRLSGRRAALAGARDDNRGRGQERDNPNEARSDSRPGNVGPGWQARGRDNGR